MNFIEEKTIPLFIHMKATLSEVKAIVFEILSEAEKKKKGKKKKAKEGDPKCEVQPKGYTKADSHDFSEALGIFNRYALQGASAWGPDTGSTPTSEKALRNFIKESISEYIVAESVWKTLSESIDEPNKGRK